MLGDWSGSRGTTRQHSDSCSEGQRVPQGASASARGLGSVAQPLVLWFPVWFPVSRVLYMVHDIAHR